MSAGVIDTHMNQELQHAKVLNWCRNIRKLYPLRNKGIDFKYSLMGYEALYLESISMVIVSLLAI